MRTTLSGLACVTALSAVFASCLGVSDDRASADLAVGRARAAGVSVAVAEGAAAVRSLDATSLGLWANAPSLRIAIEGARPGPFEVRVANAMPGMRARATQGGAELAVTTTEGEIQTELTARLEIPAGGAVDVSLGVADELALEPFRFGVYGDVQDAIDRVGDIYARMNEEPGLRFVLIVGDLTEQGTEPELERFQRELRALRVPCFATLGNHELGVGEPVYHAFFGRGSSSFVWKGARFTLLDSASATIAPATLDLVDGWLAEGRAQAHVVGMHIAPIDPVGWRSGSFASRHEGDNLLGKLAGGAVDLTVYGHVHSYYAFSNAGIPAFITGGGGAIPERMDGVGRHFLTFEIDPVTQRIAPTLVRVD